MEPFINPNIITDHIVTPTTPDIELINEPETNKHISTIIDSRKVGCCYDYYTHWKDLPNSEDSWLPFSEIPNDLYYILEQFHRHNPSRPHPPRFEFSTIMSEFPSNFNNVPIIQPDTHYQPIRSPSPPPQPYLKDQPPMQQKTRSGCLVHPPLSKDYTTSILKRGVM